MHGLVSEWDALCAVNLRKGDPAVAARQLITKMPVHRDKFH